MTNETNNFKFAVILKINIMRGERGENQIMLLFENETVQVRK